jgi:hypothetical protein
MFDNSFSPNPQHKRSNNSLHNIDAIEEILRHSLAVDEQRWRNGDIGY